MNKNNLFALFVAGFTAIAGAQTTVSTPIVGFEKKTFAAGTSGLGSGFVKPSIYSGVASSVSATSITVAGANFSGLGPTGGLPAYYIEITSGALSGYILDITSNTATVLNIDGNLASIANTTPTFIVRPHVKVSDIFNGNTSLTDYADTVSVFNDDGSSSQVLRDSSSATGWVDLNTFAAADLVVYPGQGFLLNSTSSGSVTISGQIKTTSTVVPLYAGKVNLVTPGNPSANPGLQTSQLGLNLSDYNDTVATFSSDGGFSQTANYLWGGVTDGFINPDTFAPVSGVNLPGTGAVVVSVNADTIWKVLPPVTQ